MSTMPRPSAPSKRLHPSGPHEATATITRLIPRPQPAIRCNDCRRVFHDALTAAEHAAYYRHMAVLDYRAAGARA